MPTNKEVIDFLAPVFNWLSDHILFLSIVFWGSIILILLGVKVFEIICLFGEPEVSED